MAEFFDDVVVISTQFKVDCAPGAEAVGANAVEAIPPACEVVPGGSNLDDAAYRIRGDLFQDGAVAVSADRGIIGKVL